MFARIFDSEEEFKAFIAAPCHTHICDECGCALEVSIEEVYFGIAGRTMHLQDVPMLKCTKCNKLYMTYYIQLFARHEYKAMINSNSTGVTAFSTGNNRRFNYCSDVEFMYDGRDYLSIPGLCFDDEHTEPGYLQPVYFDKKALIAFVGNNDYKVDLFSESYGQISKYATEENADAGYIFDWSIPIGFNSAGNLAMWLGDIDTMDLRSQKLLYAYNIQSDHLLVVSEFYNAQMCSCFSEPSTEKQIIIAKKQFIRNVNKKYSINLEHLTCNDSELEKQLQRPIEYTEEAISYVINIFRKHLIEGINQPGLVQLYEQLYSAPERDAKYEKLGEIKLIDKIFTKLLQASSSTLNAQNLVAPLYLLNDFRILVDHNLGPNDVEERRNNIINHLGVSDFTDCQEQIYLREIDGLKNFYSLLVLLTK